MLAPVDSVVIHSGTLVVWVPCSEGWVVAADRRDNQLSGEFTDDAQKVFSLTPHCILAATGEVTVSVTVGGTGEVWRVSVVETIQAYIEARGLPNDQASRDALGEAVVIPLRMITAVCPPRAEATLCQALFFLANPDGPEGWCLQFVLVGGVLEPKWRPIEFDLIGRAGSTEVVNALIAASDPRFDSLRGTPLHRHLFSSPCLSLIHI